MSHAVCYINKTSHHKKFKLLFWKFREQTLQFEFHYLISQAQAQAQAQGFGTTICLSCVLILHELGY